MALFSWHESPRFGAWDNSGGRIGPVVPDTFALDA